MNVREEYKKYCLSKGIVQSFEEINSVAPYDDSTLFCPAGMQKYKAAFKNPSYIGTCANIQSCIRMNDFDEIGDGSHLLHFNMMGLFSFRQMTIEQAIDFWMEFIINILKLKVDYITAHPDKARDWVRYYHKWGFLVKHDKECTWTDGEIGGYCTEFYINSVEVGNIVNPMGDCIDVGFGLERLQLIIDGTPLYKSKLFTLGDTIKVLITSGYKPSNVKQGYILRKLLREFYRINGPGHSISGVTDHPFFFKEINRQGEIIARYNRLKDKHLDKSPEWWWDTHGIKIDEL